MLGTLWAVDIKLDVFRDAVSLTLLREHEFDLRGEDIDTTRCPDAVRTRDLKTAAMPMTTTGCQRNMPTR